MGPAVRNMAIGAAMLVAVAAMILTWVAAGPLVRDGGLPAIVTAIASGLTAVCYVLVGALIEIRRPGHLVGRLMIVAGPLYGLLVLLWTSAAVVTPLLDERALAILDWAGVAISWAGMALIAGWIPLLFPTGHLPGPRWRFPAALVGVLGTAGVLAGMLRPGPIFEGEPRLNPFGVAWWPDALEVLVAAVPLLLLSLVLLALAALGTRYRSGSVVERLQVRWLLAGMAVVGAGFAGNLVEGLVRSDDGYFVTAVVFTIGILLIPATIGIAILRYRLYEIDRIISRTLAYALVTAVLAVAFVGTNVVLQALIADAIGGSTLSVAASTLVVAALFQPLRRRIQAPIDRRFNRARADAEHVVVTFAGRARAEVDLARLRDAVVATVGEAVHPSGAGLWLRGER